MILIQLNIFWMFPVTAVTKVVYRNFEKSGKIWKKKIEI